jgi:hypothetical protein
VGARGLDLPDVDLVVNLGLPSSELSYAHRAGRAGRAGAPGVVASVVTKHELEQLGRVARRLNVRLQVGWRSKGAQQACGRPLRLRLIARARRCVCVIPACRQEVAVSHGQVVPVESGAARAAGAGLESAPNVRHTSVTS